MKLSVQAKALITLSIALIVFGVAAAAISYKIYVDNSVEQHKRLAMGVAKLVAQTIDPSKVDDYLEHGTALLDYNSTKMKLYKIRESSPEIKFLYVYKIMEDGCHVVFDLDTPDVTGNEPGTIESFDETFRPYRLDLLSGREIEPIISDETYGWLLTVYIPVRDVYGVTQCYAAVDISMDEIRDQAQNYLKEIAVIFAIILIIIFYVDFKLIRNNLIEPINKITQSAEAFAFNNEDSFDKSLELIQNLKVHTGDEIENLYRAFLKMMGDTVRYANDLRNTTETVEKMQNALIMTLADLVESRDENTGQHIKKTAAYVKIILDEMEREGVYKEEMTKKFAEDVYNSAPLHDIGKISVPDAILNKPGKLTKEEFDIMKKHTTSGGKILSSIIEMVPEAHYLEEAINLATYHHERWDGKGYPVGLAGEDIPLSARIMAVADVFDALVSKRSYKDGFPLDKAMNIIIEERGTHFDPQLVDVFVAAKDKVYKVAKDFQTKD